MLAGVLLLTSAAALSTQLQNPGFEAPLSPAREIPGWHVSVENAPGLKPVVGVDPAETKQGRYSLLVEAREPARVTLWQEIFLPVGSLWRARLWVRTENLRGGQDASSSGGRMEIDTPAGSQGISRSPSETEPWTEREVSFRVPSPGRVRIVLIALTQAAGRVWFDDVSLEQLPAASTTEVVIDNQRISHRPIDLKQGGQFIEPLTHLIPWMLAQQVESTSFEEEPPWKPSYKRAIDQPHRPWYPDGAVQDATFSYDTENPFNGKRSFKIELPVARARAGISQDGFYLKRGLGYHLHLHMRSEGNVTVWAALRGDGRTLAGPVRLGRAGGSWQAAEALLRAGRDASNATLTIEFEGPGTLWLDRVYLIGEDAVLGIWRPDVVRALQALRPGVIRFGGSTLEVFEWDRCIGPWDERAPYVTNPWGGLDPNFVGVEEFIRLCHYVGAEPLICVRWTGKKPEDAAAEVEYFNGSAQSHWGAIRAKNGHADPYRVKFWQIGNEIGGTDYDQSVRAFAEAMRQVDPSIKVLSSFPSANTLREGGGYLDYLCPHHYECADLPGKQADFEFLGGQIARYAQSRDVRVAVTEWNTTAGDMGLTRGMLLTLGNALSCSRYQNLLHRYADLVEIAVRSNLVDSFGSGIIQPGPGWIYLSPTYYSQQLYQRAAGTYPLHIDRSSPLGWPLDEPDLSATLSEDERTLRIYAVNSTSDGEQAHFRLSHFPAPASGGQVLALKDRAEARDSEAMNSRNDPERIRTVSRRTSLQGRQFDFRFDPYSVTLLELRLQSAATQHP